MKTTPRVKFKKLTVILANQELLVHSYFHQQSLWGREWTWKPLASEDAWMAVFLLVYLKYVISCSRTSTNFHSRSKQTMHMVHIHISNSFKEWIKWYNKIPATIRDLQSVDYFIHATRYTLHVPSASLRSSTTKLFTLYGTFTHF